MRFLLTFMLLVSGFIGLSQGNSFPYGQVTYAHLDLKRYDRDTSAAAVVLKEFAEAFVSTESDKGLIFEHHYLIKILKKEGLDEANILIPLYKSESKSQRILALKASSYNAESNRIQETPANAKNIFTENEHKYKDVKKLTIPNVRVGSVIEVQYTIDDPFFVSNFHPYVFQSHIPKISSEYWATIPGNYDYSISWKGFLKLKKNEGELLKDCFDLGGSMKADCARYKFGMENVPAFIVEDFMTAKSNFMAAVNFELSEIRYFDGRVDKVTKAWKDADSEVQSEPKLGSQLKKGKDIYQKIGPTLAGTTDPTEKAKKIYEFVKMWYDWNDYYGVFSEDGIKKAFDNKTGNVADINLSLIAALRYAEFDVETVLLSTRNNGFPTELHPVLTDFNYIAAKLNIGDKSYLLDATDDYLPFGVLPERCLNGKGRVFPEKKPSYWYDLKATEKYKRTTILNLQVETSGVFTGTLERTHYGYRAIEKRKEISTFSSQEDYIASLKKEMTGVTIQKSEITGADAVEGNVVEKFEVEIEGFNTLNNDNLMLNPFFTNKIERNPFRSQDRLYPVDFGALHESTMILNLTFPSTFELISKPERNAVALPGNGGKFLFDVTEAGNRLTLNYSFSINKTEFNSTEYRYLKELFSRMIQVQNADLIFQKKK